MSGKSMADAEQRSVEWERLQLAQVPVMQPGNSPFRITPERAVRRYLTSDQCRS